MSKISRNEARKKKHLRIRSKISGTATKPRLNVFKSLKNFEAQAIDDVKGHTIIHTSTLKLKIKKGGNIEAAIKVGEVMGKALKDAGIKEVVFDRSGYIYHGRVQAFAEAVRKQGVKF